MKKECSCRRKTVWVQKDAGWELKNNAFIHQKLQISECFHNYAVVTPESASFSEYSDYDAHGSSGDGRRFRGNRGMYDFCNYRVSDAAFPVPLCSLCPRHRLR